jgi:tRNA-Thr(GGU) m(6)t(6)A37 methyltransferase TsaA
MRMNPHAPHLPTLVLEPIGFVHSTMTTKVEAPRQSRAAEGTVATIELLPGRNFEHALEDLSGWEYLWVIFWFHLNQGWRPKVLPPRSTSGRKGVFATRSPHRPNPLGLSSVRLERIEGLTLHIRDVDLLDGTPVLDLKPYVGYTDAHPGARQGWLGDAAETNDPVAPFIVGWTPRAADQAAWIEVRTGFPLRNRVEATLALGPAPHPYRRIRRMGTESQLAVKEWRVAFSHHERTIQVTEVSSGYRPGQLLATNDSDPRRAHVEFVQRWTPPGG